MRGCRRFVRRWLDVGKIRMKVEAVEDVEIRRMGFCWICLCCYQVIFFCVRWFESGEDNGSNVEC